MRDTKPELLLRSALHRAGLRYRVQVGGLAGRPDIVFPKRRIAVFVDGDFWHGFQFAKWRGSLSPFWQEKINKNRLRDYHNRRALRLSGWMVIRVWEHQVEKNLDEVVVHVRNAVDCQLSSTHSTASRHTPLPPPPSPTPATAAILSANPILQSPPIRFSNK